MVTATLLCWSSLHGWFAWTAAYRPTTVSKQYKSKNETVMRVYTFSLPAFEGHRTTGSTVMLLLYSDLWSRPKQRVTTDSGMQNNCAEGREHSTSSGKTHPDPHFVGSAIASGFHSAQRHNGNGNVCQHYLHTWVWMLLQRLKLQACYISFISA